MKYRIIEVATTSPDRFPRGVIFEGESTLSIIEAKLGFQPGTVNKPGQYENFCIEEIYD